MSSSFLSRTLPFSVPDVVRLASHVREVCAGGKRPPQREKVLLPRNERGRGAYDCDPAWVQFTPDAACLSDAFLYEVNHAFKARYVDDMMVRALTKRYLATFLAGLYEDENASFMDLGCVPFSTIGQFNDVIVPGIRYGQAVTIQEQVLNQVDFALKCPRGYSTLALRAPATPRAVCQSFLVRFFFLEVGARFVTETINRMSLKMREIETVLDWGVKSNLVLLGHNPDLTEEAVALSWHESIHLLGDPERVNCVIFVSDLHGKEPAAELDRDECFTIDNASLRDVFLGRSDNVVEQAADEILKRASVITELPARGRVPLSMFQAVPPPTEIMFSSSSEHTLFADDDTVVSSGSVAKAFFGYKGLPEP
jgi:hypothetical protein